MTEPIQWQPLDELGLWTENPNAGDVGKISASILEFGYNTVVIQWHSILKAGNHRAKALVGVRKEFERTGTIGALTLETFAEKSKGLRIVDGVWHVASMDISHIESEREANAFALADNRTARLGQDDNDMLLAQLMAIQAENPKWVAASGYDGEDIAELELLVTMPTEDDWGNSLGGLPDGDKSPFQQITFTVHDNQAEIIKRALSIAKTMLPIATDNQNSNGNALAYISEELIKHHGES